MTTYEIITATDGNKYVYNPATGELAQIVVTDNNQQGAPAAPAAPAAQAAQAVQTTGTCSVASTLETPSFNYPITFKHPIAYKRVLEQLNASGFEANIHYIHDVSTNTISFQEERDLKYLIKQLPQIEQYYKKFFQRNRFQEYQLPNKAEKQKLFLQANPNDHRPTTSRKTLAAAVVVAFAANVPFAYLSKRDPTPLELAFGGVGLLVNPDETRLLNEYTPKYERSAAEWTNEIPTVTGPLELALQGVSSNLDRETPVVLPQEFLQTLRNFEKKTGLPWYIAASFFIEEALNSKIDDIPAYTSNPENRDSIENYIQSLLAEWYLWVNSAYTSPLENVIASYMKTHDPTTGKAISTDDNEARKRSETTAAIIARIVAISVSRVDLNVAIIPDTFQATNIGGQVQMVPKDALQMLTDIANSLVDPSVEQAASLTGTTGVTGTTGMTGSTGTTGVDSASMNNLPQAPFTLNPQGSSYASILNALRAATDSKNALVDPAMVARMTAAFLSHIVFGTPDEIENLTGVKIPGAVSPLTFVVRCTPNNCDKTFNDIAIGSGQGVGPWHSASYPGAIGKPMDDDQLVLMPR